MDEAEKKPDINLANLYDVQDLKALRAALRSALEQKRSDEQAAALLRKELEAAKTEISSLNAAIGRHESEFKELRAKAKEAKETGEQLSKARRSEADAKEKARAMEAEKEAYAARLKDSERKAGHSEAARKKLLSIAAQIYGGDNPQEAFLRLQEARNSAENKLRLLEREKETLASRLRAWESKAEELESSRKGFLTLMSQVSESRRLAAEAQEELLRMKQLKDSAENRARLIELEKDAWAARVKEWERKSEALEDTRKGILSIVSQIPGGVDAKEALLRMMEAKNSAENKTHLLELEKEACASRLREWEGKAADFEILQKNIEDRESRIRHTEKALKERETALEERALALEKEHARERKELDEFKEKMRTEVNELSRPHEKDTRL